MKFCEYCGTKLFEDDRTCPNCGARIGDGPKEDIPLGKMKSTITADGTTNNNYSTINNQVNINRNVNNNSIHLNTNTGSHNGAKCSSLSYIAFIFMVITLVFTAWTIIALIWVVPMTVHYYNYVIKNKRKVSTFFKICSLLFVNIISGILMLISD